MPSHAAKNDAHKNDAHKNDTHKRDVTKFFADWAKAENLTIIIDFVTSETGLDDVIIKTTVAFDKARHKRLQAALLLAVHIDTGTLARMKMTVAAT